MGWRTAGQRPWRKCAITSLFVTINSYETWARMLRMKVGWSVDSTIGCPVNTTRSQSNSNNKNDLSFVLYDTQRISLCVRLKDDENSPSLFSKIFLKENHNWTWNRCGIETYVKDVPSFNDFQWLNHRKSFILSLDLKVQGQCRRWHSVAMSRAFRSKMDLFFIVDRMLFEGLPSELLLEIFSYLHPADLYTSIIPLSHARLSDVLSQHRVSLDLTCTSLSRYLLVCTYCCPSQIVFLRLTNQHSHGLLISEFFASDCFRPKNFLRLRSLHLDDAIGDELDYLPVSVKKFYVKFHKKAKYATQLYRLALTSTSLEQCYLIGGYAFDYQTCFPIASPSIQRLHMAIKTFPHDLLVVLQALPSLIKLKSENTLWNQRQWQRCTHTIFLLARIYAQSSGASFPSLASAPLVHLNIDLQGSGISLNLLDQHLLSHLPHLRSLTYHSYGKHGADEDDLTRLTGQYRRLQFIRKGLPCGTNNLMQSPSNNTLVMALQEMTNQKTIRQSLTLHTVPYPDKVLHLPFLHWNEVHRCSENDQKALHEGNYSRACLTVCREEHSSKLIRPFRRKDQIACLFHSVEIYDRVEHVRINLSERCLPSNFSPCRRVHQLTLMSNNDNNSCLLSATHLSAILGVSSVRHIIINTSLSLVDFNPLLSSMSLHAMDIAWSQLRSLGSLSNLKILSLIRECVSWIEIHYLITHLIPHLEHLQMNVTTSDECRLILDFLLSPKMENNLKSIKICICQTLSDQIQHDLQPLLLSSQWISVKWRMDNWYLYIWK